MSARLSPAAVPETLGHALGSRRTPLTFTNASSKCHVWMPPFAQDGEVVVERVDIRDGSIEIALTREATAIVGEAAIVIAWRKSPARVSRELIPPIEGVHPDARATRSDTKVKLLTGIQGARLA